MINRVVLVGRITKDPELQQTNSGVSYVRFSLACNRPFKNQDGEKMADFINCIAWRNQADYMKSYIKKGYMVGVEGRIQVTNYKDQNGNSRQSFDIYAESVTNLERTKTDDFQPQPPFEAGFQPVSSYSNVEPSSSEGQSESVSSATEFEVSEDNLPF